MNGTIRRMILATVGGLLGAASSIAQPPPSAPAPTAPLLPPAIVPTPVKPSTFGATEVVGPLAVTNISGNSAIASAMSAGPAYATGPVQQTGGYAASGPGCSSCASRVWNALTIGEGCANPVTCGNWATERTFLFGSCCQFFNPGNKCGSGLFGYGGRCALGGCATSPQGCGNLGTYNTCAYTSYHNR